MDSVRALEGLCVSSTLTLRIAGYLFLRWIPGHIFPAVIFSAFAIYATSFAILYLSEPACTLVSSSSELTVAQPVDDDNPTSTQTEPPTPAAQPTGEDEPSETEPLISPEKPTEIELTETKVYQKRKTHLLKSLLLGTPSPSSRKLSLATFAINALITLATWDLTFRATYFYPSRDLSFARIGYVGPHSAKLLVREPTAAMLPLSVWYQADAPGITDTHLADTIPVFSESTDFTKTITIPRLNAETKYRYFTSSNHTGTFTTAPLRGSPPAGGKFTFLTTSCIKAAFPYNPLQHPLSIKGFRIMGRLLDELNASFMMFLGDFIYIDVPWRPGTDANSYRQQYRQVYASPDWPRVGNSLPWLHVLDDHEIANDWDANITGVYEAAIDPFRHYQHESNPPPVRKTGETYYTFSWGSSASFFMMDSRRYRSPEDMPDGPGKTMLGEQQLKDLITWLKFDDGGADNGHGEEVQWKIIVSSVPFTKNWRFGSNDTWAGYLHERQQILEAAWGVGGRSGVVVLSGDRHEFAATAFPPPEDSIWPQSSTVHEFSCSPLNQFYVPVRTYKQQDKQDVAIKYLPDGNHKFGAITIDTTNEEQAVLQYRLFVDGVETWKWVLTAPARGKKAMKNRKQWA